MSHSDEAAPLLPGLKPVLELLSSDPQRIDCIFCKKGLRGPEAQAIQALCRERGVRFTLVEQAAAAVLDGCRN
mgnify:CR=1 FL=1